MEPIKYGENGVFFWVPGSGMTTVVRDLFNNKQLLKQSLGKLYSQLEIFMFFGHLTSKKDSTNLLKESGYENFDSLKETSIYLLKRGHELVFILGRIDNFPDKEKLGILKMFLKINSLNPRRVHIIFNTRNKPWFVKAMNENPGLIALANRLVIMPLIKDNLLNSFIKTTAKQYGKDFSETEIIKISKIYGGILQLTKEFIRSKEDLTTLELKIKILWNALPNSYKEILEQSISQNIPKKKELDFLDLEKFGLLDLEGFNVHKQILNINSDKIIRSILTIEETDLYDYLIKHKGELVNKDKVIELLRPQNSSDVSLWTIDKAVSRFRIKLQKSCIDPELLKTVKGKGFIWQ
jgi:hypothetical protein